MRMVDALGNALALPMLLALFWFVGIPAIKGFIRGIPKFVRGESIIDSQKKEVV